MPNNIAFAVSGIDPTRLMEAHGSFASASCTLCYQRHDPVMVKESILTGPGVPKCGIDGCKVLMAGI